MPPVTIFTAIIGLLTALPELLSLVSRLALWLHARSGGDILTFVKALNDTFSQVESAKTPEEKKNAAEALSNYIAGLKR